VVLVLRYLKFLSQTTQEIILETGNDVTDLKSLKKVSLEQAAAS
jgi:hypothetical protein